MAPLPESLAVALWLTGSLWVVAIIAFFSGAETEIVYATMILGGIIGFIEFAARSRR